MQIGSVSPVLPTSAVDKLARQHEAAAEKQRAAREVQRQTAPLAPAPALRPTLQDKVELTRALL